MATSEIAFENAEVVVAGIVMDVSLARNNRGLKVTMHLDSSWKREIESFITFDTPHTEECGISFTKGEKYLVYINRKGRKLNVTFCDRAIKLSDASHEISLHGKALQTGASPGMRGKALLLLVMVLAGMAFVAFVVLRKRKK